MKLYKAQIATENGAQMITITDKFYDHMKFFKTDYEDKKNNIKIPHEEFKKMEE